MKSLSFPLSLFNLFERQSYSEKEVRREIQGETESGRDLPPCHSLATRSGGSTLVWACHVAAGPQALWTIFEAGKTPGSAATG